MSAEQEQDTAAKSGKKLSALLVMGGVIIIGGGYLLLTWLSPENAASLSSVNINSTTSGGGRNVMETTGIYCGLTMNVVLQKRYVITRRLSPVCPGDWIPIPETIRKGIIPPMISQALPGKTHPPLRKIRLPGKNGVRHYRNCLPVSIHSIRMPGHR